MKVFWVPQLLKVEAISTVEAEDWSRFYKINARSDLIKIDVEGSEWKILNDLIESGSLEKSRQYVIDITHLTFRNRRIS